MSTVSTQLTFVCSFCSKGIRFQSQQLGLRVHCPACKRIVLLLTNQQDIIDARLTTHWFYRKLRFLFGEKEVGPVIDSDFLSLVRRGAVGVDTEVRSSEATRNEWVTLAQVNVALIQERVDQRIAEQIRREQLIERQRTVDRANRDKLRRTIRDFVEDGVLTINEQQAVQQFATAAGIPSSEVRQYLAEEPTKLVREVFDDAITDGILDSLEEQRLAQLAASLGVTLQMNEEDLRRIDLCRLAHALDSGTFSPATIQNMAIKLGPKETILAATDVSWHEVVATKRGAVSIGDGRYLKPVGTGTAYLTNKQVVMVSALDSKKVTIASVQRVCRK